MRDVRERLMRLSVYLCKSTPSHVFLPLTEVNVKTSSGFSHVELKHAGGIYPASKWEIARACQNHRITEC